MKLVGFGIRFRSFLAFCNIHFEVLKYNFEVNSKCVKYVKEGVKNLQFKKIKS